MLVIQMIQFSSISSKKTCETPKEIEQGPNQNRKSLTYFHQNQLPLSPATTPPPFFGRENHQFLLQKTASTNCRAAPG